MKGGFEMSSTKKGARVTTKRGDTGTTDLFGGIRVPKSSEIIKVIGCCDMTQSILGLLKTYLNNDPEKNFVSLIQKQLYECMAELSQAKVVTEEEITAWVQKLEKEQKKLQETTLIIHKFVVPGENPREAWCQLARAHVRVLEHELCKYIEQNPKLAKYCSFFNRLSDYFFVLSQAVLPTT